MSESQSPAAAPGATPAAGQQPPAAPGQPGGGPPEQAPGRDPWDTVGTVLTVVSLAALAVLVVDIALKGRLLGPLFARFSPVPASSTTPDGGQAADGQLPPEG